MAPPAATAMYCLPLASVRHGRSFPKLIRMEVPERRARARIHSRKGAAVIAVDD